MPGIYHLPRTGKDAIELNGWTNTVIRAAQVTIIFEELPKTPITMNRCDHVTLVGATLLFAEPSFTQGRIKAVGQDAQGRYFDWQIDAGYPTFDPSKSCFDIVDQHTRLLKVGTGDLGCEKAESPGKGLFRLRGINGQPGSAMVNDWLFTRRPGGGGWVVHLDGLQPLHAAGNHSEMPALRRYLKPAVRAAILTLIVALCPAPNRLAPPRNSLWAAEPMGFILPAPETVPRLSAALGKGAFTTIASPSMAAFSRSSGPKERNLFWKKGAAAPLLSASLSVSPAKVDLLANSPVRACACWKMKAGS